MHRKPKLLSTTHDWGYFSDNKFGVVNRTIMLFEVFGKYHICIEDKQYDVKTKTHYGFKKYSVNNISKITHDLNEAIKIYKEFGGKINNPKLMDINTNI